MVFQLRRTAPLKRVQYNNNVTWVVKLDLTREHNRSCQWSCKNSHAFSTDVSEIKNEVTAQLWSDETKGEVQNITKSWEIKKR